MRGREIFNHIDPNSGELTITDVAGLTSHLLSVERIMVLVNVDPQFAEYCTDNRGIEAYRLDRMTDEILELPLLLVECNDGTHLMVDGTHRYVAHARRGNTEANAVIATYDEWQKFIIFRRFVGQEQRNTIEQLLLSTPSGLA